MFTGIIEEVGRVAAFTPTTVAWSLQVSAHLVPGGLAPGDSVAVNGCCLTVTRFDAGSLWFDVLEETRRRTNFAQLTPGSAVNLERSLRMDGRLGGHFVTGHIDAPGLIEKLELRGQDHYLRIQVPDDFARYLVYKGCVAIDGISLTVAEVEGNAFAVWLIPHTMAVTNLRGKKTGEKMNLEFDLLAKYLEKLATARPT